MAKSNPLIPGLLFIQSYEYFYVMYFWDIENMLVALFLIKQLKLTIVAFKFGAYDIMNMFDYCILGTFYSLFFDFKF